MPGKLLVAGIGNIFLGDDAFGVEVIKRLAERQPLPDVSIRDFGIRSYDLAYALMGDWDLVILVDALPRGSPPGTLYVLEPDLAAALSEDSEVSASFDAHTMNPSGVLRLVRALGGKPGRILVLGCEPGTVEPDLDGRIGLSAPVEASLNEAIRMMDELIVEFRGESRGESQRQFRGESRSEFEGDLRGAAMPQLAHNTETTT